MIKNIYKTAIFTVMFVVVMASCSDNNTSEPPEEYIATDADFANYTSWTLVAENNGPDPALGAAHGGNDSTVKRFIYVKDNASRGDDGQYPLGTLVVKDTKDKNGNLMNTTAMAKRGGSFNPSAHDWEWFFLKGGKIDQRGANLLDGACVGCHSQAKTKDYVFSKN